GGRAAALRPAGREPARRGGAAERGGGGGVVAAIGAIAAASVPRQKSRDKSADGLRAMGSQRPLGRLRDGRKDLFCFASAGALAPARRRRRNLFSRYWPER